MKRKTFIKLVMSTGESRNDAELRAQLARESGIPYECAAIVVTLRHKILRCAKAWEDMRHEILRCTKAWEDIRQIHIAQEKEKSGRV